MRACPSAPGWPVSRRDKACDRKHPEYDPERAGGPVNDLSRAAWNVELPEFKHGGIGDEHPGSGKPGTPRRGAVVGVSNTGAPRAGQPIRPRLGRLRRDNPELADEVAKGEISAHAITEPLTEIREL